MVDGGKDSLCLEVQVATKPKSPHTSQSVHQKAKKCVWHLILPKKKRKKTLAGCWDSFVSRGEKKYIFGANHETLAQVLANGKKYRNEWWHLLPLYS